MRTSTYRHVARAIDIIGAVWWTLVMLAILAALIGAFFA
jgi:hypothetical protein